MHGLVNHVESVKAVVYTRVMLASVRDANRMAISVLSGLKPGL
jgi:hypothetical protein